VFVPLNEVFYVRQTNVYNIVAGEHDEKISILRSKCRWMDNIKTDLEGIRSKDVNWIHTIVSEKHTVSIFRVEDGDIYRRDCTAPKPRTTSASSSPP
jgi:hypothetical protein